MWGIMWICGDYYIKLWCGHGHSSRRSPGISPRPWRFPLVSFVLSWNRFAKTWQVANSVWCLPEMDPFCLSKHMCLLFLCVQASGKEFDSCGKPVSLDISCFACRSTRFFGPQEDRKGMEEHHEADTFHGWGHPRHPAEWLSKWSIMTMTEMSCMEYHVIE